MKQSEDSNSPLSRAIDEALNNKNVQGAFALCEERLKHNPQDAQAYGYLGLLHAAAGRQGSAIRAGKQACSLSPRNPENWSVLGRIHAMCDELENAVRCFNEAIELDIQFADGWHNLGTACKQLGKRELAFTAYKNALLIDNTRADTYLNLGALLAQAGQFEDALECFERAVKHDASLVGARSRLANQMSQRGKVNRAESLFRQSLAMDPDHIEGWVGLGKVLEDLGEAEAALAAYLNALQRQPDHAVALGAYLALLPKEQAPEILQGLQHNTSGETCLSYAERMANSEQVNDEAKALIGYGLIKFHNKRANFSAAAQAGMLASAARRRSAGVLDRVALKARVDGMMQSYTRDFFFEHRHLGLGTDQPVFIVGLPRSGTTLTEQIIDAHPLLRGAGELPTLGKLATSLASSRGDDNSKAWQAGRLLVNPLNKNVSDAASCSRELAGQYLEALREGAQKGRHRISDKSPLNFFNLALAALMFPQARVIHCYRDIKDNALSIWMENFNHDQQWSTDFDDLAYYHEQYQRLMQHWREHLPLPILEVCYEDTVANLEQQSRRMMEFLEVPWDSACLEFHQNARAVQTPSRWQVRQPIYSQSVGRWRDYADYLPALQNMGEAVKTLRGG